jgi:hypothetical protein
MGQPAGARQPTHTLTRKNPYPLTRGLNNLRVHITEPTGTTGTIPATGNPRVWVLGRDRG